MKTYKGQNLTEFAILGAVIFAIGLISLFLFSDKIALVLKQNNPLNLFTQNRASKTPNSSLALTSIQSTTINGTVYNNPVQKVMRDKLAMASVATSGTSYLLTSLSETVSILQEYVAQLITLANSLPNSSEKTQLLNAISVYQ